MGCAISIVVLQLTVKTFFIFFELKTAKELSTYDA